MSHSKGKLHTARFCPWCGVDNIQRDDLGRQNGLDFICLSCGIGFSIGQSKRVQMANRLFTAERELRPSNDGSKPPDQFDRQCKEKWRELRKFSRDETARLMREWVAQNRPAPAETSSIAVGSALEAPGSNRPDV